MSHLSFPRTLLALAITCALYGCQDQQALDEIRSSQAKILKKLETINQSVIEIRGEKFLASNLKPGEADHTFEIPVKGSPVKGAKEAAVTVVEFADFECPYCAQLAGLPGAIAETYSDDVAFVFKHYPTKKHAHARDAAKAAWAAQRQGKFWEMHDIMFANRDALAPEQLAEYARQIGLRMDKFEKDRGSARAEAAISRDKKLGQQLQITGTPTYYVNGQPVGRSLERVQAAINQALQARETQATGNDRAKDAS